MSHSFSKANTAPATKSQSPPWPNIAPATNSHSTFTTLRLPPKMHQFSWQLVSLGIRFSGHLFSLGIHSLGIYIFSLGIYSLGIYIFFPGIYSLGIYSLLASILLASILSWHLFSWHLFSLGIYSLSFLKLRNSEVSHPSFLWQNISILLIFMRPIEIMDSMSMVMVTSKVLSISGGRFYCHVQSQLCWYLLLFTFAPSQGGA